MDLIIKAINRAPNGNISEVAKALGTSEADAELQIRQSDKALCLLFSKIKAGDVGAAKLILSTLGKHRGYDKSPEASPFRSYAN